MWGVDLRNYKASNGQSGGKKEKLDAEAEVESEGLAIECYAAKRGVVISPRGGAVRYGGGCSDSKATGSSVNVENECGLLRSK